MCGASAALGLDLEFTPAAGWTFERMGGGPGCDTWSFEQPTLLPRSGAAACDLYLTEVAVEPAADEPPDAGPDLPIPDVALDPDLGLDPDLADAEDLVDLEDLANVGDADADMEAESGAGDTADAPDEGGGSTATLILTLDDPPPVPTFAGYVTAPGIYCGKDLADVWHTDCDETYTVGTSVELVVNGDEYAPEWRGDCADWGNARRVTWVVDRSRDCHLGLLPRHQVVVAVHGGTASVTGQLTVPETWEPMVAEWTCLPCADGTCAAECGLEGWTCNGCADGGCTEVCGARPLPGGAVSFIAAPEGGWLVGHMDGPSPCPFWSPDVPWMTPSYDPPQACDLYLDPALWLNLDGGCNVYAQDVTTFFSDVCAPWDTPCPFRSSQGDAWGVDCYDGYWTVTGLDCGPHGGVLEPAVAPVTVNGPTDCLVHMAPTDPVHYPAVCPLSPLVELPVPGGVTAAAAGTNPIRGQMDVALAVPTGPEAGLWIYQGLGAANLATQLDAGSPVTDVAGASTLDPTDDYRWEYLLTVGTTLELDAVDYAYDAGVGAWAPALDDLQSIDLGTSLGTLALGNPAGAYEVAVADRDAGGLLHLLEADVGLLETVPTSLGYSGGQVGPVVFGGLPNGDLTLVGAGGDGANLFFMVPDGLGSYVEADPPPASAAGVRAVAQVDGPTHPVAWLDGAGLHVAVPGDSGYAQRAYPSVTGRALTSSVNGIGGATLVAVDPADPGEVRVGLVHLAAPPEGAWRVIPLPIDATADTVVDVVAADVAPGDGNVGAGDEIAVISRSSTTGDAFLTVYESGGYMSDWSDPDGDGVPDRCVSPAP